MACHTFFADPRFAAVVDFLGVPTTFALPARTFLGAAAFFTGVAGGAAAFFTGAAAFAALGGLTDLAGTDLEAGFEF